MIRGLDSDYLLHGTCAIHVLHGSLAVLGTTLAVGGPYFIYAPLSSPLPIIGPAEQNPDAVPPPTDPDLRHLAHFPVIIAIDDLHTGIESLTHLCKPFQSIFTPPPSLQQPIHSSSTYRLYSDTTSYPHTFTLPPSWSTSITSLLHTLPTPTPICLTKGPKKCGKSTFSRTLLNNLLTRYTRVAFLECDIGQSELTPPGLVSLHILFSPLLGPPFAHTPKAGMAYKSHYLGASTPRNSPRFYLDAVMALIQTYRDEVQFPEDSDQVQMEDSDNARISDTIPLVVNTMGWFKGLGADLTLAIQDFLDPTDIFEIQPPVLFDDQQTGPAKRSEYGAFQGVGGYQPSTNARVHNLLPPSCLSSPNTPSQIPSFTASDLRTLSILSYFYGTIPSASPNAHPVWSSTSPSPSASSPSSIPSPLLPLLAHPPYSISLPDAFDSIILTGPGAEDVVPSELDRVLNTSLVAFVVAEGDSNYDDHQDPDEHEAVVDDGPEDLPRRPKAKILYRPCRPPPDPLRSHCVGLGFIRGVSSVGPSSLNPSTVDPNAMDTSPNQHRQNQNQNQDESTPATTKIHLLTPAHPSNLLNARTLVKGELEMPIWAFIGFSHTQSQDGFIGLDNRGNVGWGEGEGGGDVPYLQWGGGGRGGAGGRGGYGADKKKVRRNLMRRGHM